VQIDCGKLFAGTVDLPELRSIDDLAGRYWNAMDLVFQSAAATPAPAPRAESVQQQVVALRATIAPSYGEAVALLDAPDTPGADPALICRMRTDLSTAPVWHCRRASAARRSVPWYPSRRPWIAFISQKL
jgi:hypothetical protein